MTPSPAVSRRTALLALLAGPVAACAPSTPDVDSWRLHARRAVSEVASSVQTARLALEQALADRLHDAYLQVVALDAEEAASGSAAKLTAEQPPREERERYAVVTGRLDDATGLLGEVRIAAVDGRTERYRPLVEDLRGTVRRLVALERDLEHPPRRGARS